MACVFLKPVMKRDEGGKQVAVKDQRGKAKMYPHWFARIVKHDGTRKQIKLAARTEAEAKKQAAILESREIEIKTELRAAPTVADKAAVRPFDDVVDEFLAGGNLNGGRGGRPWSKHNAKKRKYFLAWWKKELSFSILKDITDSLGRVESVLIKLKDSGKLENTLALYREGIFVFGAWCEERGYLEKNPFAKLPRFIKKTHPRNKRRDMAEDEIVKLLDSVPYHRRMLYESAFSTGFRAGELRSLQPDSLLMDRSCVYLSADADKARQERFQEVAPALLNRLAEYAATGDAAEQYRTMFALAGAKMNDSIPANPLLYVPSQTARSIKADLKAAGIPIRTEAGKLDFHACRVAYINMVIRGGPT